VIENESEVEADMAERAAEKVAEVATSKDPPPPASTESKQPPVGVTADSVKELIEKEIAPFRLSAERQQVMSKLKLTDDAQIDLVLKVAKEHNLSFDRAFMLARHENPDQFRKPGYDPKRNGLLPPTGTSPNRNNPPQEPSYEERLAKAESGSERLAIAQGEFRKRVLSTMARHYGINIIN
jgi:hypothetical protein